KNRKRQTTAAVPATEPAKSPTPKSPHRTQGVRLRKTGYSATEQTKTVRPTTVPKSRLIKKSVVPSGLSRNKPTVIPTTAPAPELPAAQKSTWAGIENARGLLIPCGP